MISQSRLFFIFFITFTYFSCLTITPILTQEAKAPNKATTSSADEVKTFKAGERFKRETDKSIPAVPVFGSVLWDHNLGMSKCVTERDKTLLKTRMALDVRNFLYIYRIFCFKKDFCFSQKIMKNLSKIFPKNDEELDVIWEFLKNIYLHVKHVPISLTAYYDAVGGYLKSHLLPMTKISFYAGNISLSSAKRLFTLYDHSKTYLDTQGRGWLSPSLTLTSYNPSIFPLLLNASSNECNELFTLDDRDEDDDELLITLPRIELEDNGKEVVNILLPFRKRRVYNLRSQLSSFVFVRYFVAATECHRISEIDPQNFNRKLYHWSRDHLVPHLTDERLYPGLGGLLRVMRTMTASELDLKALNLTSINSNNLPRQSE